MSITEDKITKLPTLTWMPSRIPVRDALAASVAKGVEFPKELIPRSSEQRWYPQKDGGLRLQVPYDGQYFDRDHFQIEPKGWDHTTCDLCNARVPAMTICYVTKFDPHIALCSRCYTKYVAKRVNIVRRVLWRVKRLLGIYRAA